MRLISTNTYKRFVEREREFNRLMQANRWLAEFDWLLDPFWSYWKGELSIDTAREMMRKRMAQMKPAQPEPAAGEENKE